MPPRLTLITFALLVVVAGVWALPNPVSETPQSRDDAASATTSTSTAAPENNAESARRQADRCCKCPPPPEMIQAPVLTGYKPVLDEADFLERKAVPA